MICTSERQGGNAVTNAAMLSCIQMPYILGTQSLETVLGGSYTNHFDDRRLLRTLPSAEAKSHDLFEKFIW